MALKIRILVYLTIISLAVFTACGAPYTAPEDKEAPTYPDSKYGSGKYGTKKYN